MFIYLDTETTGSGSEDRLCQIAFKTDAGTTVDELYNPNMPISVEAIDNAHICGMSMGGYIAQTFVIYNPSRTLSLTSIYSHSGNRKDFPPTQEAFEAMTAPAPEEREPNIEHTLNVAKLIFGTGLPFDEEFHRILAGRTYDRKGDGACSSESKSLLGRHQGYNDKPYG